MSYESLGNIGSFTGGAAAVVALVAGLGAWKDWERKRTRDRRADVATRIIRRVAVACEDMSAAICAPAMRVIFAEMPARDHRGEATPSVPRALRIDYETRMTRALDQLREVYMLHVEARVHLDGPGEVEALSRFMAACDQAEHAARGALVGAEHDPLQDAATRRTLKARLTEVNQSVIDAREHVVSVLTPVARDGRHAKERK